MYKEAKQSNSWKKRFFIFYFLILKYALKNIDVIQAQRPKIAVEETTH